MLGCKNASLMNELQQNMLCVGGWTRLMKHNTVVVFWSFGKCGDLSLEHQVSKAWIGHVINIIISFSRLQHSSNLHGSQG